MSTYDAKEVARIARLYRNINYVMDQVWGGRFNPFPESYSAGVSNLLNDYRQLAEDLRKELSVYREDVEEDLEYLLSAIKREEETAEVLF
jgi:hypothetical protein